MTTILAFFSSLSSKIAVISAGVISFLLLVLSMKNRKIERLEEKEAFRDTKDEIIDDIRLADIKAEKDLNEALKDIDDSDWRHGI